MARLALVAFLLVALLAGCGSSKKTALPTEAPGRADGEIVFSVFEDMPVTQCGGLFAVNPGNGRIRALAGFGLGGTVLQPTFSPDGRTLTVASFTDDGSDLPGEWVYRFDQGSGELRRLARSDAPFAPVWSPQSDAFLVARVKGGNASLHARIRTAGTNARSPRLARANARRRSSSMSGGHKPYERCIFEVS